MDFFGHQDKARSNTRRLVFLFGMALLLTNAAIYFALACIFRLIHLTFGSHAGHFSGPWLAKLSTYFAGGGMWSWELLGWVTVGVFSVMILGCGYKLWQLSGGGAAVAELLGGRLLDLNTRDADERRLLNVVEEMAIAAGLPVPDVYLLEDECGINAFAAGNSTSEAAIGITFGALKLLSRDELQGVVAHEFSHILNGDMRLNTRLIGWFHGIMGLVILGRILTLSFLYRERPASMVWGSHRRGRGTGGPFLHPMFIPAFVLGAICIAAGSVGAFFARIVKSAVSRQREYLADAAAVQFTRNPGGLAGALKKIGGLRWRSMLDSARAEEASHMYFSNGVRPRWFRFTATHPPLIKRIQQLEPDFDGRFKPVSLERVLSESRAAAAYRREGTDKNVDFARLSAVIGPAAAAQEMLYAKAARESRPSASSQTPKVVLLPAINARHLDYAGVLLRSIPDLLTLSLREPSGAVAIVYAMVCSKDPDRRASQLEAIAGNADQGILHETTRLLPQVDQVDPGALLPMADLAIRALRQLSPDQYEVFRANLRSLIEADEQIDLFEYMLEKMIVRHLDPGFRAVRRPPTQYYTLQPLIPACAVLLSGLARIGHDSEEAAEAALYNGAAKLGPERPIDLLPLEYCNLPQIDAAIQQAVEASLPVKKRIFEAMVCAAATDGRLNRREAELLRAIADALDMPLPPFLCPELEMSLPGSCV
jgi:Zn-dependent protease with chaperone function